MDQFLDLLYAAVSFSLSPCVLLCWPHTSNVCANLPLYFCDQKVSQDIRKRVKAGHVMTYAEHAHLERGANVSFSSL